uniref:UCH domain-containing protein n=1 Tax=Globodera pallida TaxID=36090 RepID=A0A183BRD4_GLOPA
MDSILATDWLHNAYSEQKNPAGDASEKDNKEDQISWLKIIDEVEEKSGKTCEMEGTSKKVKNEQQRNEKIVPLLDYLCQHYKCTTKELHVLLQQLDPMRCVDIWA